MSKLNPRQQEAVRYIDGPLLVLAGAGSGKTSVITRKIAYLVEECGMRASNIAALTFTNKAAREMKERVGKLIKGPQARGLTVSTFHNLGMNIIRKEHKTLGYKTGFSIFDSEDAKALIRDIVLKDYAEDGDEVGDLQMRLSSWKNDLTDPRDALSRAQDEEEARAARVFALYNQYLKAYNAVDFDDLIGMPVKLFRDHPEVLEKWQQKIRYLLVDEYQDTNMAQYELVQQLVGKHPRFTVVGDDDQSIYAWRGARPENMAKLSEDYPNLRLIKLEQNYRSTARILKAANTLIANNPHVFDKALWSEFGMGDEIRVIRTRNEDAECERVATEIIDQKLKRKAEFRDFAVLYRGNHQSRLLEMKLQQHQIPYRLSGGTSFFARHEIKDAMGYLRLLVNPDDDAAFLRIVNVPRREIGPSTLEKLGQYATQRNVSLFRAVHELGAEQHLGEKAMERLRMFCGWVKDTARRCYEDDAMRALKQMFTDIDYEDWLRQNSSSPTQAERRMGNIWYLTDSLQRMLEQDKGTADEMTIDDAISRLILRDMMEQREEEDDSDKVHLLTLHASKGLEFPHVFIMGMEEDLLPHRNSIETDQIEEERRLMYVGITRAQRTLTLTYAGERKQYGEKIESTPSRFIDELPPDDLAWEGIGPSDPSANKVKGKATMASLMDLMKK